MSEYYKKDSPQFEYALSQQCSEPDIYFDEDPKDDKYRGIFDARLVISIIVDASRGDLYRLQAIMCLFAGLSLREAGRVTGKSHEYCRLVAISIKDDHPELYSVITNNVRGTVSSIIPLAGVHEWKITNQGTGEVLYVSNLNQWSRDNNLNKWTAQTAYKRKKPIAGYIIEKTIKGK